MFAKRRQKKNLIIMKKITGQELGAAAIYELAGGNKKYYNESLQYSTEEKVTPWMGEDTAETLQMVSLSCRTL